MKLRITLDALDDIRQIDLHLSARNPAAARRVQLEIDQTLQRLLRFPYLGRRQRRKGVRKIGTNKYAYLIYYRVDEANDEVVVMTVQHKARRRKFKDA